jgi:hypothetical protein
LFFCASVAKKHKTSNVVEVGLSRLLWGFASILG